MGALWPATYWLQAMFDSEVPPLARLVARVYAEFAGDGREAWCTNEELVRRTGMAKRSMQQHRASLVEGGWLVLVRSAAAGRAARYALVVPDGVGAGGAPLEPRKVQEMHPYQSVGVQESAHRGAGDAPKRRKRSTTPLPSTSPGDNLTRTIAQAAGWDDDDERLQHLNNLATHHGAKRRSGWLLSVAKAGDLDARMNDYLTATQPKPQTRRWRCGEPLHIGQLNEGDRCPRCAEEIRTGDRPEHMHGQRLRKEAS